MRKFLVILGFIVAGATFSFAQPTHALWDVLLKKHVSVDGHVNYEGFKVDSKNLTLYLRTLETSTPNDKWSKEEKMAYWINAYNAFTIKLIVDNYPVKSIKDINKGEPWKLDFIKIGGKSYTLDYIENQILRPVFKDPRIHFAINCASVSCPPLHNRAIMANNLNTQLDRLATNFINSERNKITANSVQLSSIFNWFSDDFKAESGSVINYINKYSKIKVSNKANVTYLDYNWNLNK